jgi:hypothetical protein
MGEKVFTAKTPAVTVTLPYSAFIALWEVVETEAKHKYATHGTMHHVEALLAAVAELRKEFEVVWDAGLVPKDFVRDRGPRQRRSRAPRVGKGKKVVKVAKRLPT